MFHLGKPILVMLVIAVVTGAFVTVRPGQPRGDLTVWVFADSHYKCFVPLVKKFCAEHGIVADRDLLQSKAWDFVYFAGATPLKVNLNVLSARAEALRLAQLFMSDPNSEQIPDVAEVEIGLVARFFRPPVDQVGFLPLNERLKQSGWYDRIVEERFAPWSKEGVIFGVPHDVHPCTITYRKDLFEQAGVDLPAANTWPKFQEACLKFKRYWRARGYRYRHAMELAEGSADDLQKILLQRGLNPIDSYGNVYLDQDIRYAQTLAFYAQMVAGPRKISSQTPTGPAALTRDLTEGNLCALITPDWRLAYIKRYGVAASGKMRLMPMPVFDPTDHPTSTWGGTMIGITKASRDKELAWKVVEYLYFSADGQAARKQYTEILPPIKTMWNDPYYHEPDPFFGGQKGGELLTALAPQIPPRYVTPATPIMSQALNDAVSEAVNYVNRRGTDGLEAWCRRRLTEIAADLRARMAQWRFEK
jgi:arabinosaccharide transport system substrate-binding protein